MKIVSYCLTEQSIVARGTSISLGDPHRRKIEQIIEAIYKSTGKHVNASVAVQIALIAFQLDSNFESLVSTNESFDKRRKSTVQTEKRKALL